MNSIIYSRPESSQEHGPGISSSVCFRKPCLSVIAPLFCFVLAEEIILLWQFCSALLESCRSSNFICVFSCGNQVDLKIIAFFFFFLNSAYYVSFPLVSFVRILAVVTLTAKISSLLFKIMCIECIMVNLQHFQSHQQTFNATFYNRTRSVVPLTFHASVVVVSSLLYYNSPFRYSILLSTGTSHIANVRIFLSVKLCSFRYTLKKIFKLLASLTRQYLKIFTDMQGKFTDFLTNLEN